MIVTVVGHEVRSGVKKDGAPWESQRLFYTAEGGVGVKGVEAGFIPIYEPRDVTSYPIGEKIVIERNAQGYVSGLVPLSQYVAQATTSGK